MWFDIFTQDLSTFRLCLKEESLKTETAIMTPVFVLCLPDPFCSEWAGVAGHQGFLEIKDFFLKTVCWTVKEVCLPLYEHFIYLKYILWHKKDILASWTSIMQSTFRRLSFICLRPKMSRSVYIFLYRTCVYTLYRNLNRTWHTVLFMHVQLKKWQNFFSNCGFHYCKSTLI